jgi:hypothetical protein
MLRRHRGRSARSWPVERGDPRTVETLRVTDAGIARIATSLVVNRAVMSRHEALWSRSPAK